MSLKKTALFFLFFFALLSTRSATFTQSNNNKNFSIQDSVLIDSLNARALSYRYINLDSVEFYANKSFKIALNLNYIKGRVEAVRLLSVVYVYTGKFSKGIELLFKEKLKLEDDSYDEITTIDYTIGLTYSASGNYKAGLPFLNRSVERFRELKKKDDLLQCLNNIGVCYIRLNQFDKALDIFKEIDSRYTEPSASLITTLMVNFGYCYYGLGEYDSAKMVLDEFFAMPKDSIDERGYGFAYFKLGEVYVKEGDTKKAIDAFKSSIDVFDRFKTHPDKVEAYNGLAQLNLGTNNYLEALRNADEAVKIAQESGILLFQKSALETRYQILKKQNKFQLALEDFERFKNISDSLIETQQSAEMGRITAQYGFDQQRNQLLLEQKEAELKNQEILNQQQLTIQVSIVVILAIIILMAVIYRGYALKIRSNKILTEKNNEIQQQRDKLDETNKVKNKLLSIIGHDLKAPLSSLNGLLNLIKNKIANAEDLETILPKLIENFDTTSNLLNNLLNWTRSQMEGYTLEFEVFDIHELVTKALDNAKFRMEDKGITYEVQGDSTLVFAEEHMIEIVCQNLIANAIKFSEADSKIKITIVVDEEVCLSFKDSGIGISQDRINFLIDNSTFSSTVGTNNERGSGLGLIICKDFLEKNNSKLSITSEEKKGSTFSFCLPRPADQ